MILDWQRYWLNMSKLDTNEDQEGNTPFLFGPDVLWNSVLGLENFKLALPHILRFRRWATRRHHGRLAKVPGCMMVVWWLYIPVQTVCGNLQQPQSKNMMGETKETKTREFRSWSILPGTLRHIADSQSGYVQSEDIQSKYNHLWG